MVWTTTGANKSFRVVEHIQLAKIQEQAHGYFGLLGNGNFVNPLPIPLEVSSLTHLSYNDITQATEIQLLSYQNIPSET